MDTNKIIREFLAKPSYNLLYQISKACADDCYIGNKVAILLFAELTKYKHQIYSDSIDNANVARDYVVRYLMKIKTMDNINLINLNNIKLEYAAGQLYPLYRGIKRFILALITKDIDKVRETWNALVSTNINKDAIKVIQIYDDSMYDDDIYKFLYQQGFKVNINLSNEYPCKRIILKDGIAIPLPKSILPPQMANLSIIDQDSDNIQVRIPRIGINNPPRNRFQ